MNKVLKVFLIIFTVIVIVLGVFILYCKRSCMRYRLGDMIKGKQHRDGITFGIMSSRFYHYLVFPNSIASKYMKRTDNESDLEVLSDIILHNKYSKNKYNNTIIIHIRTGDVLEPKHCKADIQTIIDDGCGDYCKPFSYYKYQLEQIPSSINKITIISGNHDFVKSTKSLQYLELLKQRFADMGYEVEILYNQHPDKDFTIMCLAKYFIPSAGGFSTLAKNTNEYIKVINKENFFIK